MNRACIVLPAECWQVLRLGNSVTLDPVLVTQVLDSTEHLGGSRAERVWRLAVSVEQHPIHEGWPALSRLYAQAEAMSPSDPRMALSLAVSALDWLVNSTSLSLPQRLDIGRTGLAALSRLRMLNGPSSQEAFYRGQLHDSWPLDEPGRARRAEWAYREARRLDPTEPLYSLYLGHSLGEQERWSEAIQAYKRVDLQSLVRRHPDATWRIDDYWKQLAQCLAADGAWQEAAEALHHVGGRNRHQVRDSRLEAHSAVQAALAAAAATGDAVLLTRLKATANRHPTSDPPHAEWP